MSLETKSIAVIGQGFVGGSLTTVFSERGTRVFAYDKFGRYVEGSYPINNPHTKTPPGGTSFIPPAERDRSTSYVSDSVAKLVAFCEMQQTFSKVYFVCLPTPMYEDGEADLSIVDGVLAELAACPGDRVAVVKSTVPPGSTEAWNTKFNAQGLHVVFNPEFLTEANAVNDMRNQNRIVLGGPRPHINAVKQVFQTAFPDVPIVKTSATTAEMVKYFTNVQLAARVVLSCELAQVCEALDKRGLNIDYDKVKEYASYDKRLGGSHMSVPGSDGIPGARGHCFPKDLNALIFLAKAIGVSPTVMSAVWEKNLEVVPVDNRDWEKMAGRAVSKKK